MKATIRIPLHLTSPRTTPPESEEADEDRFVNRPCYEFNRTLARRLDDARCRHCRHYLTASCPHVEEFLEHVDDLSPE